MSLLKEKGRQKSVQELFVKISTRKDMNTENKCANPGPRLPPKRHRTSEGTTVKVQQSFLLKDLGSGSAPVGVPWGS